MTRPPPEDRLDSWKAIARHLGRSVRTVRRWEQNEGLPVHRLMHQAQASVFAFASELDAWREERARLPDREAPRPGDRAAAAQPPEATALAVLPFTFAGPDATQAWVADGFTEEMIAGFSHLAGLRVTSRTSSAAFKGSERDPGAIARVLGVSHLLEGSVIGDGSRLRISVRLIDTEQDDHVWSRRFTGDMEQVFDIQERIARAVVAALQVHLAPEEDQRLAEPDVTDVRAWQRIVLARQATLRWRPDALDEARRLLEEALALTGDNVAICAALGRLALNYREAGVPGDRDSLAEATHWAERAGALNPDHPETRVLGGWLAFASGDLANAIANLELALESDRDHPDALLLLANCLLLAGQVERARPIIEHGVAVDPLTPVAKCMPGYAEACEGDFEAAVGPYRAMLDADPGNPVARLFNTWILFAAGKADEALAMAGSFDSATEDSTAAHIARRFAAAHLGTMEAVPLPKPVREGAAVSEMYARLVAESSALAGEAGSAAQWLRTAMRLGFANWPYVEKHSPFFRVVADDPDFDAAAQELKERWEALDTALRRKDRGQGQGAR